MTEVGIDTREYIESILRERKAWHDEVHALTDEARQLQAKEYERRLELLNQSFERSAADRADFVRKEEYKKDQEVTSNEARALALRHEAAIQAAATAVDLRFRPLEKLANRAAVLLTVGVLVGGIVGALIQKALLG